MLVLAPVEFEGVDTLPKSSLMTSYLSPLCTYHLLVLMVTWEGR